jgi:hypothetical protein
MKNKLLNHTASQAAPELQKTWLVQYAVMTFGGDDEETYTNYGLVVAPDILAAEETALRKHVEEGFEDEDDDEKGGEWTTVYPGFRAYQLNSEHAQIDSENVFYIKSLREVDPADVPILRKYLDRKITPEQELAEEQQQLALRSVKENCESTSK